MKGIIREVVIAVAIAGLTRLIDWGIDELREKYGTSSDKDKTEGNEEGKGKEELCNV
jgi:hypothetical protein